MKSRAMNMVLRSSDIRPVLLTLDPHELLSQFFRTRNSCVRRFRKIAKSDY